MISYRQRAKKSNPWEPHGILTLQDDVCLCSPSGDPPPFRSSLCVVVRILKLISKIRQHLVCPSGWRSTSGYVDALGVDGVTAALSLCRQTISTGVGKLPLWCLLLYWAYVWFPHIWFCPTGASRKDESKASHFKGFQLALVYLILWRVQDKTRLLYHRIAHKIEQKIATFVQICCKFYNHLCYHR